ncbi:MAG: hypothetical protein AAF721_05795 [Myxococcota bacterium]
MTPSSIAAETMGGWPGASANKMHGTMDAPTSAIAAPCRRAVFRGVTHCIPNTTALPANNVAVVINVVSQRGSDRMAFAAAACPQMTVTNPVNPSAADRAHSTFLSNSTATVPTMTEINSRADIQVGLLSLYPIAMAAAPRARAASKMALQRYAQPTGVSNAQKP